MQVAAAAFLWVEHRFAADAANWFRRVFDDSDYRLAERISLMGSSASGSPKLPVANFKPPAFAPPTFTQPLPAEGNYLAMVQNRIKRYEALWSENSRESPKEHPGVPAGFTVQLLGHLDPQQRQSIANQRDLYQWAYEQARKDCDQRLFWDWSI